MKLYVYDHCPFCVKARMIFGLKGIPFDLVTLLNDDEATPVSMIGAKMVPILQKEDGAYMPESMDIVNYIDRYQPPSMLTGPAHAQIAEWLKTLSAYVNQLLMPRYAKANLPEFATQAARDYYCHKKQAVIGDFAESLANTQTLVEMVNTHLQALEKLLVSDTACNGTLSTDDIHLFAALRGLSIVKGIHYPERVEAYRRHMSRLSGVNLLDNIAM